MMQWYNKKTNELSSAAPWGDHYYDPEIRAELFADWSQVADDFIPPALESTKTEKMAALDAAYQPQFTELAQALGMASLDGNQTAIDGIKADYATLKAEYTAKMGALS